MYSAVLEVIAKFRSNETQRAKMHNPTKGLPPRRCCSSVECWGMMTNDGQRVKTQVSLVGNLPKLVAHLL